MTVSLRVLVGAATLAVALAACTAPTPGATARLTSPAAPTGSPSTPTATTPTALVTKAATPRSSVTTPPTATSSVTPLQTASSQRAKAPAPRSRAAVAGANGACAAAGLRIQQVGQDGAAGHIHFVLALTNTTATSCTLSGYPTLVMLDPAGHPMLTRISHRDVSFAPTPPRQIRLAPRASASFDVGYSHVPVDNETSCPAASAVLIQVGAGGKGLRLSQSMDPCNRGAVATSALTAGRNGTSG
jgi:hypothetical protein